MFVVMSKTTFWVRLVLWLPRLKTGNSSCKVQGRSQDFSKWGSHCVKHYRHGVSARNIVGCLLKKGLREGLQS